MITNSFNRALDLLESSLSATSLRRQVITNNLSNAETPNFKRSEVSFEARLGEALKAEKEVQPTGYLTNEKHIPFSRPVDINAVDPRVTLDYLTTAKNNGNNVDVERELNDSVKNQMMYELMTSVVSHQFRLVNIVLS
ncbi:MAG: flagellar basal-body rod protein FlgB [Spirochaeta sp. LUC14_002_19_P3]|nr:MAG: flagellar basal-body rod protein FlgB [Spirochaeta sp. LUC14_002_19_P3]